MDGYTSSELVSIFTMQAFAGISLFSVFVLMALGLAIIFGQMGVINMAHGEFLTVGAYATVWISSLASGLGPDALSLAFLGGIPFAFFVAFGLGYLVEFALIRHLYRRPLDSLLATWGLSLVFQQLFRSSFGAREVSAPLPGWLMGSWSPREGLDIPLNGLFVLGLTVCLSAGLAVLLFRSRWGFRVRATTQNRVMAGAVGIHTARVDRLTFALGCGIAGVAGAAFTTIGSTGPTSGSLYIVDTFLVVVFGGAGSLLGTFASAFAIAQTQSIAEFFTTGSMAKVLTLLSVLGFLMLRPQGLIRQRVRS